MEIDMLNTIVLIYTGIMFDRTKQKQNENVLLVYWRLGYT